MSDERILVLGVIAGTALCAFLLTAVVLRVALARGVVDIPNSRSSHVAPTPRGGGFAIVIATVLGLAVLALLDLIAVNDLIALVGGGLIVAAVGFADDCYQLRASVRLVAHFSAALWAMWWLGGLPPLQFGATVVTFGWGGYALGAVGIVWTLNLFNFMDGIDGIAASEAIFVAVGGAVAAVISGAPAAVPAASLVFGAACSGFLPWNRAPAKIFMGDIGSGFLGYMIVGLALVAARYSSVALLVWVVLGGVFFVDATVTLIRRVARGESAHQPHRSHAYQWLARRWRSHKRVVLAVLLLNILWLLPCALLSAAYPKLAGWILCVALTPLIAAALSAGAGRSELCAGPASSNQP